jgi:pimeloyl-ACP methyl ester carboxylesterase
VGGPVHVVSAKSGAITALRLAATRPDLVKSVILTCPPLTAPGHDDWVPHIDAHGMRSYVRWTMPARLGNEASPQCIDWWVDLMGAAPISTAHAYFKWVVTTDPLADLQKTTCPVLAIMTTPSPENNTGAGQRSPKLVKTAAPQADVVVLDMDCYHASAMAPDRCVQETLRFLQGI